MSVNMKRLRTPFRRDGPNGDPLSSQSPRTKKPRLTTAPASTLDSSDILRHGPLAMDKATHLLTPCANNRALWRGDLCLILSIINLLGLLNLLIGMFRSRTMIPRAEELGGLAAKRFKIGGGARNGNRTDNYFPP